MGSHQLSVVSCQKAGRWPRAQGLGPEGTICQQPIKDQGPRTKDSAAVRTLIAALLFLVTWFSPVPADDDLLDKPFRHLFVPLEEFDSVMARNRKGVLLKRPEFEALVAEAIKNKSTEVRPAGLVVSAANYTAKIDGDLLLVTATIQFNNFEKTWAEIHFPSDGLSVEKCQINGQPALAGWHGENPNLLRIFTDQPGAGTLTLDLSARLSAVGSDLSTAFGVIPAASGELVVSLPAGKFLVADGVSLARAGVPDAPAEYRVAIGGKNHVALQITNRQASTRTDSLTLINTAMAVAVAPGEVAWSTKANLQVVGRPLDKVVCTVPMTLEITGVESTGLDSWQLADTPNDPARTTITLAYRQAFDGNREITFRGVLKAASDMAWEVPTLVFNDITSQVGIAEVRYPPGVRLRVGELDGVRTVVSQAAVAENGDSLLHFQIWKPGFRLPFVTEPKTREVRAAVTNLLDLNAGGLDFTSVINLQTRLAPLFDAQINLPASWQIRSVFLGDQPVTWQVIPMEAGVNQVRVTFPAPIPAEGTVALTINAGLEPEKWPVEDEPVRVALPKIQLPQAAVIEGLYGITAESALDLVPSELLGLDGPSPEELALLKQKIAASGRELRLGFSLQDSEYRGQLAVSRKPARISSQANTFFRIEPDMLSSHIETLLKIEGGGVRKLIIDLPEATGTDLRFQLSPGLVPMPQPNNNGGQQGVTIPYVPIPPLIVEQTAEAPRNGVRRWTLRLDRYATETSLLAVDIRHPKPAQGPFNCPVLSVIGAERETGFVAIEASQEQFLSPLANDLSAQPLIKVDPVDFPPARYRPKEPIVAGYRYTRPGWSLTVGEQRFDRAQVPTAVGHSAAYQTVLGRNGELQHQADLVFTAIGVQNLKVQLPGNVDLWAVQLDGQPQEIRRQGEGLLVAVPQDNNTEARHTLTLFYRAQAAGAQSLATDFRQVPPAFTVLDGQGTEQPLAILTQSWRLDHPDHLLLVESPGAFQPKTDLDQDGSLGQWSSLLRAPSPKQIRDSLFLVSLLFLGVWGVRKTVERFGWSRAFGGSAVGLFAILIVWAVLPMGAGGRVAVDMAPAAPAMNYANTSAPTGEIVNHQEDFNGLQPFGMRDAVDGGAMGGGGGFGDAAGYPGGVPLPVPVTSAPLAPPAPAAEPTGLAAEYAPAKEDAAKAIDESVMMESLKSEEKSKDRLSGARRGSELQVEEGRVQQDRQRFEVPARVTPGQQAADPLDDLAAFDKKPVQFSDEFDTNGNGLINAPKPASGAVAGKPQAKLGGLLSLALALVRPDDSRTREFTYLGEGSTAADLHLKFVQRDKSRDWTGFVMAAVVVAAWFLRKLPLTQLGSLIALLILGSLAIAPLLPTRCQAVIDGLFFGGWAALLLGLVYFGLRCLKARCCPDVPRTTTVPLTTTALLLAMFLAPGLVSAQDQKAAEVTEPKLPNHVVLPYTGDDPSTADRVYIPQHLYLELYKRAHPEEAVKPAAPIDGWVVEALHAATFEQAGNSATVHVKSRMMLITTKGTQFAQVLPIREVALKSAVLDGKPAAVQTVATGYTVVVDKPGLHVLDVEFDLPATTEGPAGRFTLKTNPTAAAKLSVQLPKIMGDRDLKVNGATGLYRIRETETGPMLETAIVDRVGDITVSWQPRAVRGAGNTIVHVDTGAAIVVDDAGLQVNHQFAYKVRQGAINEVVFQAPPALAIREISGPDVGGWQLDGEKDSTRLKVFLRRTVEDQTSISIDLFSPLPVAAEAQNLPLPELVPMDATREIGQIGLFAGGEFAMRVIDAKGATQIDVGKYQPVAVPHRPEAAPLAAYRFATRPASLTVSLSRRQPETKCIAEHGVLVGPRKLEWASHLQFDLTGAPRPSVSVTLPPDYLLMDVDGSEFISDWYDTPGEGGYRTLTVEFDQPRLGQVTLLLTGQTPRKPEATNADLLPPAAIGVAKLTSSLAVWLSDIYSATVRTSDGWKNAAPEQLSDALRALRPIPVQFAFRATAATSLPVIVDLTRQVAQLSADLVILSAVADDSIDYGLTFRWKISRAATDTFRFTTPGWLKDRLELTVPGLRQVDSKVLDNGEILWTVQLIDAVRNQFLCSGVVTLPPPADDMVQIPDVRFMDQTETGELVPLESQRRCAIVVNRSQGQLLPIDDRLINKIPREQLPLEVQSTLLDQALSITELSAQQALPRWKISRNATQDTGRATVTGSDLVTSLTWDGTWRTKATYTVRNRGQQFLGLRVPEGSQLLSVFVKGQPSRTVTTKLKEQPIHLVPLPQTSVVDLSFDVQITLAGKLATPLKPGGLATQQISLPAPDVISRDESTDFGLTVAHTSWQIHTPDKLDVTLLRDGSNVEQLTEEEWFATQLIRKGDRLRADMDEMIQIVKSSGNASQKSQAVSNLRQIGEVLKQQSIFDQPASKPEAVQLFDQARSYNESLQKQINDNTPQSGEAVQQALPQIQAQSDNRDFVNMNNFSVITSNGGDGIVVQDNSGVNLKFNSESFAGAVSGKKSEAAGAKGMKMQRGRGELRRSLATQSYGNAIQGGQGQQGGVGGEFGFTVNSRIDMPNQQRMNNLFTNTNGSLSFQQGQNGTSWNRPLALGLQGGTDITFALGTGDLGGRTWTQVGGLSLPVQIPEESGKTVFSRVGGSPKVTIALRPRQASTRTLTWLWSLCWAAFAVWVIRRIRHASGSQSFRPVLGFMAGLAAIGFLLLPDDLRVLSLLVFVVSLIGALLIGVRRQTEAE